VKEMLKNPTADKLRDMRLRTMAEAYLDPEPGSDALSFEDRFAMLVEKEWYAKRNARITRLQTRSGFSQNACLEDVEYGKGRNISRKDVTMIGTCLFIEQKLNIIISGKTGSGKSYLACAIGNAACRHGYSCKYYRMPELLAELEMVRLENRYLRFMETLRKFHLLVIDDIGLKSYSHEEARDLLEIAELRYNRSSTIFASQAPHEKWYELIPDPTIADAFMDRVVHNSYILPLDSKVSMREIMAQKKMKLADLNGDNL
jgi:DNA replication protein DnaC